MRNAIKHLRRVILHKRWVLYYCHKAGTTWRGIKHDMSKFSPTEFIESVKFYDEKCSPIIIAKEHQNGISYAWLHHKSRNTHHYEYWQDSFDSGTVHLQMPFKDALEAVCDYLATCKIYNQHLRTDKELFAKEFDWWKLNESKCTAMHPQTKIFIGLMFNNLNGMGIQALRKPLTKCVYKLATHYYELDKEKI